MIFSFILVFGVLKPVLSLAFNRVVEVGLSCNRFDCPSHVHIGRSDVPVARCALLSHFAFESISYESLTVKADLICIELYMERNDVCREDVSRQGVRYLDIRDACVFINPGLILDFPLYRF